MAYARVMFIGKEGSGKSSLLDGLMGRPFREGRDSTALAEQKTLKYWWMQVETGGNRVWTKQTEEDQCRELAARSRKVANEIPRTEGRNELSTTEPIMVGPVSITDTYQSHVDDISGRAMLQQGEDSPDVLHVWDCGGQPVFLDILSAFITTRTFFLLTFNAAESIHAQCGKSVWRLNGQQIPGRKRNITNIQLLIQWLQLIYTTVSSTQKKLVKAMPIGSHGDEILSTKDDIIQSVVSACKDKAFGNILLKCVIVNNRTAGQGEREDPAYGMIRESIHSFIEDVKDITEDTPLSWISFRSMVMDLIKKGKNVYILSKADASQIAKGCNIPNVDSVLEFYHQLGVFLYFSKSCPDTIFVNPHWLFQQLCKLLMPGDELQVTLAQRNSLDNSGILSSEVYQKVSRKCGLGDDDLVNILDNFDLAKQIPPKQAPETLTDKNIFFVPCMLQNITVVEPKQGHVQSAPLHIVFKDMGCVPPGFFIRLAAQMVQKNILFQLHYDQGIFRNCIPFVYRECFAVTIFEPPSIETIHINVSVHKATKRKSLRYICHPLCQELYQMSKEACERWLPSVKLPHFAFKCEQHNDGKTYFAYLKMDKKEEHVPVCKKCLAPVDDTEEYKHWLPPPQENVCIYMYMYTYPTCIYTYPTRIYTYPTRIYTYPTREMSILCYIN